MSHNNLAAFNAAKEITIAQISAYDKGFPDESNGRAVSAFFETVFHTLSELEDEARKPKNDN